MLAAEEIFYRALELEPSRRGDYLQKACGGDSALMREVTSLLSAFPDAEIFFKEARQDLSRIHPSSDADDP